ncbi:MAG: histidine phosphotransferase family protein [Pseudomonadota bacterium]
MTASAIDLAARVGSRICHDLVNPLGAVGNGLELLSTAGLEAGPELALVSDSVTRANARIKLLRIAFGQAHAEQRIARAEAQNPLSELFRSGRTQVLLDCPAFVARREMRMALLGLLCLETAIPFGGSIVLWSDGTDWRATARSDEFRIRPETWNVLSDKVPDMSLPPAQIHFAMLRCAAEDAGRSLRHVATDREVELAF